MPKLSNNEFDEILSEYARAQAPLTGEQLFTEVARDTGDMLYRPENPSLYRAGTRFHDLPPKERFFYSLVAKTAEEVLAEEIG